MTATHHPRLLGDVGGTNARFAWQHAPGAPMAHVASSPCNQHGSLTDAIEHYLREHELPRPRAGAIGIANPITGDKVSMTNHHWSFSIAKLQRELGLERLVVINDFAALAMSLPWLGPQHLRSIGGGEAIVRATRAVLGPGTGLGVSGLLQDASGRFSTITGEGGHVTLAASDDQEADVLALLRQRFDHVSAERVLSGPGLINLYAAVATLAGQPAPPLNAADILVQARTASNSICRTAIDLFCSFLGAMAGNLALTLGARGGVYIGGGIAPRMLPELLGSRFRERFESKGRFADYLAPIPTWVIDSTTPAALIGASHALDAAADA